MVLAVSLFVKMFRSPFLSEAHWPVAFFPQSLFHYFSKTKHWISGEEFVSGYLRLVCAEVL